MPLDWLDPMSSAFVLEEELGNVAVRGWMVGLDVFVDLAEYVGVVVKCARLLFGKGELLVYLPSLDIAFKLVVFAVAVVDVLMDVVRRSETHWPFGIGREIGIC